MSTIYIVEDDPNIRQLISYALESKGYKTRAFAKAGELYEDLDKEIPSLFLLDIMLEGEDGYQILERLKTYGPTKPIPVIMLTAKTAEYDRVKGLDMGADDYICKPFGVMELMSRIKAVLRRYGSKEDKEIISIGRLELDREKRRVSIDKKEIVLTYKEFELLSFLMENYRLVISRDKIMEEVWGFEYAGETRTIDVHIRSLRLKLGELSSYIKTVRNVGYKLEAE